MSSLTHLRETRQGRRLLHSLMGMVTAWTVSMGLCVVVTIALLWFEKMSPGQDPWGWVKFLGAVAIYSALVCLIAWLVVGLPIYYFCPRKPYLWHPGGVSLIGGIAGGMVPFALLLAGGSITTHYDEALLVSLIPAAIGAVSAFDAWRREEKFLRKFSLQIHGNSPVS